MIFIEYVLIYMSRLRQSSQTFDVIRPVGDIINAGLFKFRAHRRITVA